MDTVLQLLIKQVYGKPTAYPANAAAERLAEIAGTKTLTANTIALAAAMGFTFEVKTTVGDFWDYVGADAIISTIQGRPTLLARLIGGAA